MILPAQEPGVRWLAESGADYPAPLRVLHDPPARLCVQGTLAAGRPALAIVGSRRPSPYGLRMASALAKEAAQTGWVVVSGLARGIDTAAHEACLAAGGTTWAVLGSGLNRIYPAENGALARRIVSSGGCLLSEFELDAAPLEWHFPRRNRIVAGLSWATIVVEGKEHSGALITARLALDLGREVFAVPGPADSKLGEAPFILLKEGAAPIRTLADAWPALANYAGCAPSISSVSDEPEAPASLLERKIVQCLGSDTRTLEELGQAAALDIVRLSTILLDMELNGFIQSLPGQRYAKKRND